MYRAIYHQDILKHDLAKIPQNIKAMIRRAIEERLLQEPWIAGEPLRHSLRGHRKLRVGDYRVIYRVQGNTIIVLKIGLRK